MNGAQGIVESVDKHGASIVITEKFEPADTSMIPQLTKVKAAHPDLIMLYANANPAAVIAKNYQQLGMEIPLVGSGGIPTPDFLKLVGKIIEGGRWIIFGLKDLYADLLPPDDPYRKNLFDPLLNAIKEKYGKTEWNGFYRNGYDPIRIAIEGLRIAGTDDRAALRDALEKVRYQGFLGDFKYSPTDHEGTLGEAFVPVIIKEGRYSPFKK
jgi:branched-chain amino acid transport system substrate-binding protein